jgi:hypothetical protein
MIKDKDKFMLFETMQNCPTINGVYFFEHNGVKKVAELLFVGNPSDKSGIVLVLFNKDNPVSMKRKDLFILARHVGDYVESVPGRFIEQ